MSLTLPLHVHAAGHAEALHEMQARLFPVALLFCLPERMVR